MSAVAAALGASSLFASMPVALREDLGRLMRPVAFARGELVFRQGDRGQHLVVLESGELEALLAVPGREPLRLSSLHPGDVVGELALLGDGHRMATVRAVERSTGWALARVVFDVLRHDLRPAASAATGAIGRLAVKRLSELYRHCASELNGEPMFAPPGAGAGPPKTTEPEDPAYVLSTLFFRDFDPDELASVTEGLRWVEVVRGTVVVPGGEPAAALWVVLRGAVETTMRGSDAARRLRLAGPGRAVGHLGLLDEHAFIERRESRARERAILLEIPWPRVRELLNAQDASARRFAAALWTDVVRALEHGQRPLARMGAHTRRQSS